MNNIETETIVGEAYEILIRKEATGRWFWRVLPHDQQNKFEYGTEVTRSSALEKATATTK